MKNNLLRKITALLICAMLTVGILPTVSTICVLAAYSSAYPERIADEVMFDNLDSYTVGTTITRLSEYAAWWDPGNNQNEFVKIADGNDGKVLSTIGETYGYPTFTSPNKENLKGQIWIDIDVKLPVDYSEYRFQIGDFNHPDRALLCFIKDGNALVARNVQDPAGGLSSLTISNSIPQNEWFTLSIWFDIENERYRVYINGAQVGETNYMNYKFACTSHGESCAEASFAKVSFAHRGGNDSYSGEFLLDNFSVSYAREIKPISTMEIIVDKGESYTLPATMELELNNGAKQFFPVTYTAVGQELDVNTVGSYEYTAEIDKYPDPVTVWIYVKERTIASIDTIYEKVYKDETYTLPATIKATMNDGSFKDVPVIWDAVADVSQVGTTDYTGTVEGYGTVTLNLEVVAPSVLRADDLYIGVAVGEAYVMPTEYTVIFENHKYGKATVTWEAAAANVDTTSPGKYEFTGIMDGYDKSVKLFVTVYEKDSDLDYIMDVLEEYYTNCITTGRDRSMYFPEEYANGYDPVWGEGSGKAYSPLFSMGISRETNSHALWPTPSGDRPLAVPATQGPLIKGLMGMTALTGDSKYHDAAQEEYDYLINNRVDPNGHILHWGDHILQEFSYPNLEDQSESDSYAYMVHQMECDYPEYDLLFAGNPEAAARYIKAFWVAHFDEQTEGIKLDTMEFTRHATATNVWDKDFVDNIFTNRYDFSETAVHKPSGDLTFINAAVDYAWAAVKLWQNTGDEDALHYARKLLWCYNEVAYPDTGLVPFMFTYTQGGTIIGDVYDPRYVDNPPDGRAQNSYSKVLENPEKYGTVAEHVRDSYLMNQGKCGGGNFYMPMICFDIADVVGGEVGAEIEQWGLNALMGFVNYTYDHKTGFGKSGMSDGTVLDDYKAAYTSYYQTAGRAQFPFTITSDMSWLLLDGYERANEEDKKAIWEVLRSVCMSFSIGDIGTAPGENVELDIYTLSDNTDIVLTLSRLYELTGDRGYYDVAKRIVKRIINERFINGYFYKSDIGAYARLADPAPYAILYFVAASEGRSKMIPHYQGESFDFQTKYKYDSGTVESLYGKTLFDQTIVSEVLPSAVNVKDTEITLSVGDQYVIYAEVFPEDADDVSLEWTTDNTGICVVQDGYVTALSPGVCTINAEAASGVSANIKITVK